MKLKYFLKKLKLDSICIVSHHILSAIFGLILPRCTVIEKRMDGKGQSVIWQQTH